MTEQEVVIKRLKPETVVTLPLNRVQSFSCMDEPRFMEKYHGTPVVTSKSNIPKYYLVIEYDNGMIALWGTAKAARHFTDLQYKGLNSTSNIQL